MELGIVSFIFNNQNEKFIDNFINNLTILSINGFYIQYNQLKKLINYNKNYFTSESNIYGLNNNQFRNLIRDFFKLEDHCNNSNNNNSNIELIYNLNNFNFDNIKINYSLYIIIDNNKKNVNNKLIIDYSNNSNQTTILFFKIWRNSVLKSEILNNIRLYNIHYNKKFKFQSMNELSNYKFKNYITSLEIFDGKYYPDGNDNSNSGDNDGNSSSSDQSNIDNSLIEKDEYDLFENDDSYFNNYNNGEINKKFKYNLPPNLLELIVKSPIVPLDHSFKIERMLPCFLTHLEFQNFNRVVPVGALPLTLESIVWGNDYNQPILPGLLSSNFNLKQIAFGLKFQQNIYQNTIPNSAIYIYFSSNYSGTIYQVLDQCKTLDYIVADSKDLIKIPKYCQNLYFLNFNEHIHPNVIPDSVTRIDFGNRFNLPLGLNSLPPYVRSLSFDKNYSQRIPFLTSTLTELSIGDYPPISWPSSLVKLKFGWFYNSTMDPLPRGLTHLDISEFSLKLTSSIPSPILPQSLPPSLKELKLCKYYNVAFSRDSLPSTLTSLTLGDGYTQVIPCGALPNSLKNLDLGDSFNNSFNPSFLPDSLERLSVGSCFNQDLAFKNSLPKNLKFFVVNDGFPILKYSYLPKSLIQIQTSKSNFKFINSLDLNISKYLLYITNSDNIPLNQINH